MKLSALAAERGIDAFSFEDFLFVGRQLAQDPDRLILVGGQALETWGHVFNVPPPTGEFSPLTEDTDFLGSKKDAIWLCNLLGRESTELIVAKDFDPSVNTAIAYIERPDKRILMIDFLRAIIGVDDQLIKKTAVPIDVAGIRLHVLHPLLCLQSRLANLEHLRTKRNTNGVMQANWAVAIVREYLSQAVRRGATQRELISEVTKVVECAEYKSGPFCFRHFSIDPLQAITTELIEQIGGRFVTEDWPRRVSRVKMKRAAMAARITARWSIPAGAMEPVAMKVEPVSLALEQVPPLESRPQDHK